MKISKITNENHRKYSFKANLYYKNEKIQKGFCDYEDIADYGNQNTDIFIKTVKSEKNSPRGGYNNSVTFEVNNPLLGNKKFIAGNIHETNGSITENEHILKKELYRFFTNFLPIECYENNTLQETLLKKSYKAAKDNTYKNPEKGLKEVNPEKILENMLFEHNPEKLGFSEERIEDFRRIAKALNNKIVLTGSEKLLNI